VLTVLVATALAVGMRARALGVVAVVTALAGTAAFTVATAAQTHGGSIPLSGPVSGGEAMGGGPAVSTEVAALLSATDTTWSAATSGATTAADLALASGTQVIAIGGWSGGDPAPTLAEFQQYVADGQISYYVSGGGMRGDSTIGEWVAEHYQGATVGGQTVYDLT
jgi:hypothetical protein